MPALCQELGKLQAVSGSLKKAKNLILMWSGRHANFLKILFWLYFKMCRIIISLKDIKL